MKPIFRGVVPLVFVTSPTVRDDDAIQLDRPGALRAPRDHKANRTVTLFRVSAALALAGWVLNPAALGKDEKWLRVSTAEYTLVTSLTDKEATVWAGGFSQYIAELRNLFHFQRPLTPLTIVVFAREKAFEDYRPLNEKGKPEQVAGFFLRHHSWAVVGLAGANAPEEVRRTIFHEGVHWFLSAFDRPNPIWVEEGLAEVFSTFTVTRNKAEWGRDIPVHVMLLHQERLLPTDRLLYVGRSELFQDESSHTGIVYAQSWATVHFLLYGQSKEIPRSALFEFLKLTNNGTGIEPAFRQAMGCDYATFDQRLNAYLRSGTYYLRSRPLVALPPVQVEPAPPIEIAQALGRLALAAHRYDKAAAFARDSIAAAPNDPRGYELLGLAHKEKGDADEGLEAFTTAIEKETKDFQPYFEVAFADQRAAQKEGGEGGELAPAEARRIADNYERAILLFPRFQTSYQNLAGVIARAEPLPHDRQFLELGNKIYPNDGLIRIGLAVLTDRAGEHETARKAIDEIEADPNQPGSVRAYARRFLDGWSREEIIGRISALAREQKYDEALGYLEAQLQLTTQISLRTQLVGLRPQLKAGQRSREIAQALNERRWEEARRLLEETIAAPEMPAAIKTYARRTLGELDRRGTGQKSRER